MFTRNTTFNCKNFQNVFFVISERKLHRAVTQLPLKPLLQLTRFHFKLLPLTGYRTRFIG